MFCRLLVLESIRIEQPIGEERHGKNKYIDLCSEATIYFSQFNIFEPFIEKEKSDKRTIKFFE